MGDKKNIYKNVDLKSAPRELWKSSNVSKKKLVQLPLGKGSEKKPKKMWTGGALWGGGLEKYLPVHNSIVIFGKLSLGGN